MRRPWVRGAIGVVIAVVVGYFFYVALRDDWQVAQDIDLSFGWWMLGALVAFVAAVAVSGLLWGAIVLRLDSRPVPALVAIRVHFASWLLKYIPGKVSTVVNKVWWAQQDGRARAMALVTVVYENAFLLIGSTIPMLAILITAQAVRGDSIVAAKTVWVAFAAVLPLLAVMQAPVFRRIVNTLARRTLKREVPPEYFLPTASAFGFQAAYLVPRVINGIGVVLIAAAIADAGPETWVPLTAAYALAGAAGIIVFFTPSGLFVREAVFVLFAGPYLGHAEAIIVASVARAFSTLGDGVIAAAYGGLRLAERRAKVGA